MSVILRPLGVDLEAAAALTSLSESSIQELVRKKEFPAPRQLSPRRVGWLVREIEEWLEGRPVSDLPPPPNTGAKKPRIKPELPAPQDGQRAA